MMLVADNLRDLNILARYCPGYPNELSSLSSDYSGFLVPEIEMLRIESFRVSSYQNHGFLFHSRSEVILTLGWTASKVSQI